jgi:aspartyl-tRNA(Asn)/glutamyl-tRNA(Gln) amidotransferase subunit A
MTSPVAHRSVLQFAATMASGAETATGIAEATLEAIAACPDKAVFTATTPERARREADAAAVRHREGRPLSLLDGIPVAWKDLFDLEGEVTRAGSVVLDAGPAAKDAVLAQRLAAAGAVSVGKLNLTEFAFSGIGLNPHYGTPVNPWSRDEPRVPGGSSSGSGVAVARGLVPIAIGTDTGGSVRIPAAFNGIIGFKPSGARWSLEGCFPLSKSLDTAGVLCRTVVDAVIVDAAARGLAAPDVRRVRLDGLRIVVPTNVVFDGMEPAVAENFEAALGRLAAAGASVERRALQAFDDILALNSRHGALVTLEAYAVHRERLLTDDAARMDRRVATRISGGSAIGAEAEAAIRAARPRLIGDTAPLFDGRTLVAYPTLPHTAPKIAALEADDDLFVATNIKTLRNTMLGNFLDWCGISIPTGFDEAGLPTAVLLSAGPAADEFLLGAALSAEPLIRDHAPVGPAPHAGTQTTWKV